MHDLRKMIAATTWMPKTWQRLLGSAARPYCFWWMVNAIAQGALDTMGLPAIQKRSDHVERRHLRPPVRGLAGAEFLVAGAFKTALRQVGKAMATPPQGEVDVLVALPRRGWEGQDRLESLEHAFLGPVLQVLASEGVCLSTCMPLLKDRHKRLWALGQAVAGGRVHGLPHEWIDTYWNRDAGAALRETTRHFRRLFNDEATDLGLALAPDDERQFRAWLSTQAVRLGFFAGLFVAIIGVLRRRRPRALLTTMEGVGSIRMWVFAARCLGIPTVSVQHGWIGPGHHGYFFAPPRRQLGELEPAVAAAMPDALCVFGPYHKKILSEQGPWSLDSLVVTGAPRYDRLTKMHGARAPLAARLRLDPNVPWIAWATQTHGLTPVENAGNVAAVRGFLDAAPPDQEFLIKLHPLEPPRAPLYQALGDHGARIIRQEADTLELVEAADVLITGYSTVGLEAAALDTPLVVLNTSRQPDKADYVDAGIARRAVDAPSLLGAIQEALQDDPLRSRRRAYATRNLGPLDGKASERCAAVVREAMASRRTSDAVQ